MQTVCTDSEDVDYQQDESGESLMVSNETIRYWPALSKRKRPDWMGEYGLNGVDDGELNTAMRELYTAFDNDLPMLAAIGIRTAFDISSGLLGVNSALTFKEKMEALVTSGNIRTIDKGGIEVMVDAGNASVHRGWRPQQAELATIMDILEHFLHDAFIAPARRAKLDSDAAAVKTKIPPKTRKLRNLNESADSSNPSALLVGMAGQEPSYSRAT